MIEVDILKDLQWQPFMECNDFNEVKRVVERLTLIRPNKAIRIMEDNIVICWLDGTEYQLEWFKNRIDGVRERTLSQYKRK